MRRIAMLLAGAALGLLALAPAWGAEKAPAATAAESAPVKVAGEVPMRPELQVFQGVRGWLVNGQEITLEEVKNRAVLYHGPYVLQEMVAELLLAREAKRRGVTVSDAEVDEQIRQMRVEWGITSDPALDFYLRRAGLTGAWLREKAHDYVMMEKVLGDQVYVSDREVGNFYQQFKDQYRRPESVRFRVISLSGEKEAQSALAQLRSGRSFQQVAKDLASPEEKPVAGAPHTYERGGPTPLPPELEQVLFAAPLDQVVGPIKAANAYHLLRAEKKADAYQFSLEEVRDTIRTQLRKQKLEQAVWPRWIEAQLAGAEIQMLKAGSPTPGAN